MHVCVLGMLRRPPEIRVQTCRGRRAGPMRASTLDCATISDRIREKVAGTRGHGLLYPYSGARSVRELFRCFEANTKRTGSLEELVQIHYRHTLLYNREALLSEGRDMILLSCSDECRNDTR
jgi:hypothetical protein